MGITREKLGKTLTAYDKDVLVPMNADTTGGATWKLVQAAAKRIPAALQPPLDSINQMYKSKDPSDRTKIPVYFKAMKAQWSVVKIDAVKKYLADHEAGGAKSRQSGLKAVVSTGAQQAKEKKRIELCKEFITYDNSFNSAMKNLTKPGDFGDLEGM